MMPDAPVCASGLLNGVEVIGREINPQFPHLSGQPFVQGEKVAWLRAVKVFASLGLNERAHIWTNLVKRRK